MKVASASECAIFRSIDDVCSLLCLLYARIATIRYIIQRPESLMRERQILGEKGPIPVSSPEFRILGI